MKKIKSRYLSNTILNYIYKVVSLVISYIIISKSLSYLSSEKYGIWQTILTIVSWGSVSNLGIGNGVRNKITESLEKNNIKKLKGYVTNAYIYLTIISIIILLISIIIICSINLNDIFKNSSVSNREILISFIIIIFSFCLNLILGISSSIAFGIHKSSIVNLFFIINNILILLGVWCLKIFTVPNIIYIALVYFFSNTITNLIFTAYIFKDKNLLPSIKYINRNEGRELISTGLGYLILQIASIILFSTDNFIISAFIGINQVTEYSLVYKLFQIVSTLFSILLVQLWSEVSRAQCIEDYRWIKNMMNKLIILLIPLTVVLFGISIEFKSMMQIWLRKSIYVEYNLVISMSIFVFITCLNGIFVNIQNGMGKIKVQIVSSVISCILNIPLSIVLINVFNLGILGVVISNIICISISTVMCGIDVVLRINKYIRKETCNV
ncbi:oligosaccharide flippase family protein [uncultured Clostridium sp.]|uniref:oligosaccharide flippase family protein n=1 Tax=uncultured Clostridium sp. TaxID=59620 RepID=UPI00258FF4B5|nr:oligosaccharide flippase family protein [uncultured Clostridium sp.]